MAFKTKLKIYYNILLWLVIALSVVYHSMFLYLVYQAKGQLHILTHKQSFEEYKAAGHLTPEQVENLKLIEQIKLYSVDSLAYKPTNNFTEVYDQNERPLLWVISASEKFKIQPYYWHFPLIGSVSYKGFFDQLKAVSEKNRLIAEGYDVDLRSVSAWSTLGWFSDPVLSSMLNRSKGSLCNLIFHELFHATYYAPSSVDYNENLASFIAHKATLQFLRSDTAQLRSYVNAYSDNLIIDKHIGSQLQRLNTFYDSIASFDLRQRSILKLQRLSQIAVSLNQLPVSNSTKVKALQKQILSSKNAWFVDFEQYNALQDSLEGVFNKNYKSNLRKMVQSLK